MAQNRNSLTLVSDSPDDTYLIGSMLGAQLHKGDVIAISGELGAGKTVFVKGMSEKGRGVNKNSISSPTFSLLNVYEGCPTIHHIDLYRLASEDDVLQAGLLDIEEMPEVITIIEWPGVAEKLLPQDTVSVTISYLSDTRRKIDIGNMALLLYNKMVLLCGTYMAKKDCAG